MNNRQVELQEKYEGKPHVLGLNWFTTILGLSLIPAIIFMATTEHRYSSRHPTSRNQSFQTPYHDVVPPPKEPKKIRDKLETVWDYWQKEKPGQLFLELNEKQLEGAKEIYPVDYESFLKTPRDTLRKSYLNGERPYVIKINEIELLQKSEAVTRGVVFYGTTGGDHPYFFRFYFPTSKQSKVRQTLADQSLVYRNVSALPIDIREDEITCLWFPTRELEVTGEWSGEATKDIARRLQEAKSQDEIDMLKKEAREKGLMK